MSKSNTTNYTLQPVITKNGKPEFAFTNTERNEFADSCRPFQKFPVDCLPEPARAFVIEGARAIDCDSSMVALPLLTGIAACIGSAFRVVVKKNSWFVPSIFWTCIIGKSGCAKSPAQDLSIDILNEFADERRIRFEAEIEQYKKEIAEFDKQQQDWQKAKSKASSPPLAPTMPTERRVLTTNATIEGLADLLQQNRKGLLYYSDELAGWIGSFVRHSKEPTGTMSDWLSIYNGRTFTHDRKQAKSLRVRFPNVCVTGGIQPERLFKVFAAEHLDSGLVARILFAHPPTRARKWTDSELDSELRESVKNRLRKLLELQPAKVEQSDWKPHFIKLDSRALTAYLQFKTQHQAKIAEYEGATNAALAKLDETPLRLALVLHLFANPAALEQIEVAAMESAIRLAEWFTNEALRLYESAAQTPEQRLAARLLELLQAEGGLSVREMQHKRRFCRDMEASTIENLLFKMARAGLVTYETEGAKTVFHAVQQNTDETLFF